MLAEWDLGNEPEGWMRNFNMSVSVVELARDFRRLRDELGSAPAIWGPDYGIQGCVTKGYPCKDYDELIELLESKPGLRNASTWHYYNLGANGSPPDDTASEFILPHVLDRSRMVIATAVAANAAATNPSPVWLGEGATASGGGIVNASGTATFIWIDKLGATARWGGSGLMRQSLFGGRYALLDPVTFVPRPTYWVALLALSPVVLAVDGDQAANRTVRLYARCGQSRCSSLEPTLARVLLAFSSILHSNRLHARTLYSLGSSTLQLNGAPLTRAPDGSVPTFVGKKVNRGRRSSCQHFLPFSRCSLRLSWPLQPATGPCSLSVRMKLKVVKPTK